MRVCFGYSFPLNYDVSDLDLADLIEKRKKFKRNHVPPFILISLTLTSYVRHCQRLRANNSITSRSKWGARSFFSWQRERSGCKIGMPESKKTRLWCVKHQLFRTHIHKLVCVGLMGALMDFMYMNFMKSDERRSDRVFKYAHANAIRQAVNLVSGPVCIVVGIHSDAETNRCVVT